MQEFYNVLKNTELFRAIPDNLTRRIYESANIQNWKAGEVVRAEQSQDDQILLIVDGEVRSEVLLCNADQRVETVTNKAGQFLGLYHLIEAGEHPWSMTAKTDVKALVWQSTAWRTVFEQDPAIAYHTASYVARQLYRQAQHLSTYLLDNICWGLP